LPSQISFPEGTPAGWNSISGIRLSPWKAVSQNSYLALSQLRAVTPQVLLVKDTQTTNPEIVQQTIDRHIDWLEGYGIRCGVVTRAGVEGGLLPSNSVAILPYNETVSEAEMSRYESHVAAGGKLIVYYLLPSRLASLLGIRVTGWTRGDFAAWRLSDPAIPHLPARVLQASWNITLAEPTGAFNSRITARWEDSHGQNTGRAAWIRSDRGFYLSHVLLGDDPDTKSYALLCLLGTLLPEVWPEAAAGAISRIGEVGPFLDYEIAASEISGTAADTLRSQLVEFELAAAVSNRSHALSNFASGHFPEAILSAQFARTRMRQAYIQSLKPVYPEFRAMWEHHATGPYPGNWDKAAAVMASNHFNAIFPNMLWGGLAHYNSAVLPLSAEFIQYGDQITACVNAARNHGLEVHVWKVNWNLSGAPQSFVSGLRAAGRTQVSRTGENMDWLCPSHPENFALETDSMLEVVRNYDIDGIHFDYIRYPNGDYCYCTGCGSRFQGQTGLTVGTWPDGVLSPGALRTAFLNWRRAQITRLVQEVYTQTKALKPHVKVSAAVFPHAASAYDDVGQDWRLWVTNGILDFVCPMDYTTKLHSFQGLVEQQAGFVAGRIPMYPGIGAYVLETDAVLAQMQVARAAGTGGFILFELSPASATTLLPALSAGATAPDEPDLDDDGLPDSWEVRWFGNLLTAGRGTDSEADGVPDREEYLRGTDPTQTTQKLAMAIHQFEEAVEISGTVLPAEGAGYRNAARHYRLETTTSPGPNASWTPVPGFTDVVMQPGTTSLACRVTPRNGQSGYYRLRVWLQQWP
jgi:uncharacterized lipoprotein YddW (UPF0748 family)